MRRNTTSGGTATSGAPAQAVRGGCTYNGGDGELVLASILEQLHDIVANDDAGLAAEDIGDTHDC